MGFAKTRITTRLKCCACQEVSKVLHRHEKCNAAFENVQKYCACHTKRLLTRLEPCWNATKCHACHAKWSYATLESSKSDPFCRTSYRHGHTALTRTLADGCGRLRTLRTVAATNATSGEHSFTPTPPEWNRNHCYAFGNKSCIASCQYHKSHRCATSILQSNTSHGPLSCWYGMGLHGAPDSCVLLDLDLDVHKPGITSIWRHGQGRKMS